MSHPFDSKPSRRQVLGAAAAAIAAAGCPPSAFAQRAAKPFEQWMATFKPHALARGISAATYDGVMSGLKPDMGVFALQRAQP